MSKEILIEKIQSIVNERSSGSIHVTEIIDLDGCIEINRMGKTCQEVIDVYYPETVGTTVYVKEVDTETREIPYEDLDEDILEAIYLMCEKYI